MKLHGMRKPYPAVTSSMQLHKKLV